MEHNKIEINSFVKSVNGQYKGQIFQVKSISSNSHSFLDVININGERETLQACDVIMANNEEIIAYENKRHKDNSVFF